MLDLGDLTNLINLGQILIGANSLTNASQAYTDSFASGLLSGKTNMTLETLAKLEKALQFDLIGRGLEVFHYPLSEEQPTQAFLNDSNGSDNTLDGIKTSVLVDGYKPRKKKGPKATR